LAAVYFTYRKQRKDRKRKFAMVRKIQRWIILIPARDEEAVIGLTLSSLASAIKEVTNKWTIIVIDDGSRDKTAEIVKNFQRDYGQNIVLLQRFYPNCRQGKSEALNAGFHLAKILCKDGDSQNCVIGVFDADSQCFPELFKEVEEAFSDVNTDAVQCGVAIKNKFNLLPMLQHTEFSAFCGLAQFVRDKTTGAVALGGNAQFALLTILEEIHKAYGGRGPWSKLALTEDLDLTFRAVSLGAKIRFCKQLVFQEGVERWLPLFKQRFRWAWGTIQVFFWNFFSRKFWKSPISLLRKLEMAYYLSFWIVPLIVITSLLLSLFAWMGSIEIKNAFPYWLMLVNSFSFLPLIVFGLRKEGYPLWKSITFGFLSAVYSWHWVPSVIYGISMFALLKKPHWAKTERCHPCQSQKLLTKGGGLNEATKDVVDADVSVCSVYDVHVL